MVPSFVARRCRYKVAHAIRLAATHARRVEELESVGQCRDPGLLRRQLKPRLLSRSLHSTTVSSYPVIQCLYAVAGQRIDIVKRFMRIAPARAPKCLRQTSPLNVGR
jgi:hypothetical protein